MTNSEHANDEQRTTNEQTTADDQERVKPHFRAFPANWLTQRTK